MHSTSSRVSTSHLPKGVIAAAAATQYTAGLQKNQTISQLNQDLVHLYAGQVDPRDENPGLLPNLSVTVVTISSDSEDDSARSNTNGSYMTLGNLSPSFVTGTDNEVPEAASSFSHQPVHPSDLSWMPPDGSVNQDSSTSLQTSVPSSLPAMSSEDTIYDLSMAVARSSFSVLEDFSQVLSKRRERTRAGLPESTRFQNQLLIDATVIYYLDVQPSITKDDLIHLIRRRERMIGNDLKSQFEAHSGRSQAVGHRDRRRLEERIRKSTESMLNPVATRRVSRKSKKKQKASSSSAVSNIPETEVSSTDCRIPSIRPATEVPGVTNPADSTFRHSYRQLLSAVYNGSSESLPMYYSSTNCPPMYMMGNQYPLPGNNYGSHYGWTPDGEVQQLPSAYGHLGSEDIFDQRYGAAMESLRDGTIDVSSGESLPHDFSKSQGT